MKKDKILVTSALPYANGPIHLGHLSGAYLPADIYVRYKRLLGDDIIYVCGSDEHGVPITISADKENVNPKEIIDRYHKLNKDAFDKFGMSFDIYSRTSADIHHATGQEFFKKFYDAGLLVEKKTLQFYDKKASMFLPDRYVEGTCPSCKYEEAKSDECENCSAQYDPSELINPKSKISGDSPELKETSHWYFPLDKFQKRLEDYVSKMNESYHWKDNVLQQCKSWFNDGLKERAVTRDLDWGIEVPVESIKGKVLYVWFEAVLGYISATKEFFTQKGDPSLWKNYWLDPETKYVAFIGKDNIVFHTIIFPAMLMAWNDLSDDKYILPQNVPANEFLNFEGKKFSKSRGWGIDVTDFLEEFPADPLRYTLATNLPENKDTDFYWKDFQARHNNELADILGNFVNRTFIFAQKHFNSEVPQITELSDSDNLVLDKLKKCPSKIGGYLENYKIKDAVFEMMNLARIGNKYFNDSEPWVQIKQDKVKCANTINICLQIIYTLAEVFEPVIPFTSAKMFEMLNAKPCKWNSSGSPNLDAGHKLNKPEILFHKIDDSIIEDHINNLGKTEETIELNLKPQIDFSDFEKVDLRVAEIINAEKIKKSKKLLKLKVKLGAEEKQVIAGIATSYKAESLIGKKVVMVANLKPAQLFGHESQGMILALEDLDGKLKVLEVPNSINSASCIK